MSLTKAIEPVPREPEVGDVIDSALLEQLSNDDIKTLQLDGMRLQAAENRRALAEMQAQQRLQEMQETALQKGLHRAQLALLAMASETATLHRYTGLSAADSSEPAPDTEADNEADKSFTLRVAIWKTRVIPVYWENPTPENAEEREWIRNAVKETWEKESAVQFVEWKPATEQSKGIRILLEDSGPRCKRLGRFLSGVKNGMILNLTFQRWCPQCPMAHSRQSSIEWVAVHEFGHALGFAHEHNRDDRDARCLEEPQGTNGDWKLTVYDPDSVMNYCNREWNNFGKLSELDIQGIQILYGKPSEKAAEPVVPTDAELDPGPDPVVASQ